MPSPPPTPQRPVCFDVFVPAGGALIAPWFLTFSSTNPATLAYEPGPSAAAQNSAVIAVAASGAAVTPAPAAAPATGNSATPARVTVASNAPAVAALTAMQSASGQAHASLDQLIAALDRAFGEL